MKKLFIILILACCFLSTKSYGYGYGYGRTSLAKYQGEILLGYDLGVGTFGMDKFTIHTIQGVRIGKYFSTGLGFGANLYPYYENIVLSEVVVPIYLNLKGYAPLGKKVDIFASFDIGGGVGVSRNFMGEGGLYFSPALGFSFKFREKSAFNISVGYTQQRFYTGIPGIAIVDGSVSFKIGFHF